MIEVRNLRKVYHTKEKDFVALDNINLEIEAGEFVAILGESGSGKTTLLNMLSGVDEKTDGKIYFNGEDVDKFDDAKWRKVRNQDIGFIFQRFNLIDHLTVMENVILPLILTGSDNKVARDIARRVLKEVELEGIEDKLASELSGGQKQRVAIARTIMINPTIILADEPTGALDSTTAKEIMKLLQRFADGRIIILVTHDEDLAYENATRVIRLHDGKIIDEEIIKEKNAKTKDFTNRLLSYETKVTRRLKKRLEKQYPQLKGKLEVGKRYYVPMERKYIANNPVFTRKIARENYKQKIKVNRRILWSFVVSISLLLLVNLVMKNITEYNFRLFEINNNYVQYRIENFDDANSLISQLDNINDVGEASNYYEHYVQEMYLVNEESFLPITSSKTTYNKGVFSPKLVSLPKNEKYYYLNSEIIAGNYPQTDSEIIVSSEFILNRFYGYSMQSTYNQDFDGVIPPSLKQIIGNKLYVCGETLIDGESEVTLSRIEDNCFEYEISGVLNSYYKGIDYVGNIYVPINGFESYIEHLRTDKGFTRVDEYYKHYVAFYPKDSEQSFDIKQLSDDLGVTITNPALKEYNQTKMLETMLEYMYLAIFIGLIIISGTIDINIVTSSVHSRIREIGIYSSIGVSKKSIRNMFLFETLENAIRIILYTSIFTAIMLISFRYLYRYLVVDLTDLEPLFGINESFSFQIGFNIFVILGATAFLFASVMVPSFKAANMRAVDALRSG